MAIIVRKASVHYGRAIPGYVVISNRQAILFSTKREASVHAVYLQGMPVKKNPATKRKPAARKKNPVHAKIHNLKYEVMVLRAGDKRWLTEAIFNDPKEAIAYAKNYHKRHAGYTVKVDAQ